MTQPREKAPIQDQKEETVKGPIRISLPVMMSGEGYIVSQIPDAPMPDEPRENVLFYRDVNKYEWVGIGYDSAKQPTPES